MAYTYTKEDIANHLASKLNIEAEDAQEMIKESLDFIKDKLRNGDRFELRKFAVMKVVKRKVWGRNFKDNTPILSEEQRDKIVMKPSKHILM